MATQGTATIDFGPGNTTATVAVTGQAAFTAGTNLVEAWLSPLAISGGGLLTTEDEHWAEALQTPQVILPITGTGFTVALNCFNGRAFGKYNVAWVWN